jgi:G:T-mismatch repair DNA endonuclease (very short patch repair protein)
MARDEANRSALRAAGWSVLCLWEHEKVEEMASKVEAALQDVRAATRAHSQSR